MELVEIIALRGLKGREILLQTQTAKVRREIDEDWAALYTVIEERLGLETGSILRGEFKLDGDKIVEVVKESVDEAYSFNKYFSEAY